MDRKGDAKTGRTKNRATRNNNPTDGPPSSLPACRYRLPPATPVIMDGMDAASRRPWYRLHWPTWAALVVVGGALVHLQIAEYPASRMEAAGSGRAPVFFWNPGFPWAHAQRSDGTSVLQFNQRHALLCMLANAMVSLAIAACTLLAVESWLRRPSRPWQLSMKSLLILVALVAVLLSLHQFSRRAWPFPYALQVSQESSEILWPKPADAPWYVVVPLVFGLTATLYIVGWLAGRALRLGRGGRVQPVGRRMGSLRSGAARYEPEGDSS